MSISRQEIIEIVVSHDWDGILSAGDPYKTNQKLKKGKYVVPLETEEIEPKESNEAFYRLALQFFNLYFHRIRPIFQEARDGLAILKDLQANTPEDIKISLAVLSGRELYLHDMSRTKLRRTLPNIFDDIYLNERYNSAAWKELKVREAVAQHKIVIHIEDDLEAALRVARVSPDYVRVYLLKNKFYTPDFFAKNHIQLPKNIFLVDSYSQAVRKTREYVVKLAWAL